MNEEIKKEFIEKFGSNQLDWEYNTDAEVVWEWIDQKLREQYLQGIKDFQIAISMPISDYGDANFVLRMQDIKAQQFIDSLEGKDGIKYNN